MDKITMDFINDSVLALFGRTDFVGGIDNEALDFGQLESFAHLPNSTPISSNGSTTAITIAVTAITTPSTHTHTPLITTTTTTATHSETPSHLPESPPDSGSEPPYSPTDLHAINSLNPLAFHQQQRAVDQSHLVRHNLHQTQNISDTASNMNCNSCHNSGTLVGANNSTNIIHKTEDLLLSSTAIPPITNSVSAAMILPNNDMMLQQNAASLLELGVNHHLNQSRSVYRNEHANNILALPPGTDHMSADDFNCLMSDVMFQTPNHLNHLHNSEHQQQHQQQVSQQLQHSNPNSSYNQHLLTHLPQISSSSSTPSAVTNNTTDVQHLINTRKRHMPSAPHLQPQQQQQQQLHSSDFNSISIISSNEQNVSNGLPIKRSTLVALPVIKPEPDALSPLCTSALIEPMSPPSSNSIIIENCGPSSVVAATANVLKGCDVLNSKQNLHQISLMVDTCSNISSCSTSSSPPVSTSIIVESLNSASQQQANNSDGSCAESCPLQCIRFSPFQQQNWHILCDQSLQELPLPHYRVDADKGFNFSNSDDAFVCQKKNHFQITCHAQLQGATAIFVRTDSGLEKIKSFHLHFYGVKLETPTQTIRIEQSQSDRSKKPFHPVPIDLQNRQVSKVTVGRLHFSETTSNNMRKKGRPNPEQRYFQLVVGLHAHTHSGNFPVISHGSERIIVRASNPGQFESDVELCWQRGVTQDSIFTHAGRVGINTDRPDESLVVHGNLKISGHIVQPSDSRAKQEISELDTSQQLQNVKRIRVVKYRYEPEFAVHSGLAALPKVHSTKFDKNGRIVADSSTEAKSNVVADVIDTGVIAQEIREVLPDAVQEAGSVLLPNGVVIDNFLLVNKDRIYMENIGAVKELCKVTGSLETRIEHLERMNSRLVHIRKIDHHHKPDCAHLDCKISKYDDDRPEPCSNKMIQITIVVLVIIMAICLAAISTLYFVEHSKQNDRYLLHQYENAGFRHIGRDALSNNSNSNGGVGGGGGGGGIGSGIGLNNNGMNFFDNWRYMNLNNRKLDYSTHGQPYFQDRRITLTKAVQFNAQNLTGNRPSYQQQLVSAAAVAATAAIETSIVSTSGSFVSLSNADEKPSASKLEASTPKSTTPIQITSDDLEKPYEYEQSLHVTQNNHTESGDDNIIIKQIKLNSASSGNPSSTSDAQTKSEKIVDIIPILGEPHDLNWTSNVITDNTYLLTDVDTNFIDVGQRNIRNGSKLDDKIVLKSHNSEADLQNINGHIIFESEYHRERTIRQPIGTPSQCTNLVQTTAFVAPAINLTDILTTTMASVEERKENTTTTTTQSTINMFETSSLQAQCSSACSKDSVINQAAADVPEVPEIAILENIEMIETSTGARTSTTKLEIVDNVVPIEPSLINANANANVKIDASFEPSQPNALIVESTTMTTMTTTTIKGIANKVNKIAAIHAERPIEIRDSSVTTAIDSPSPSPSLSTAIAAKVTDPISTEQNVNSVYHVSVQQNELKDPIATDAETKVQNLEPNLMPKSIEFAATASILTGNNDIKTVFTKKTLQIGKFDKTFAGTAAATAVEVAAVVDDVNKSESAESSPSAAATNPNANAAIVAAAASSTSVCLLVQLLIRTDSFNVTFDADEICPQSDGGGHNFNITYNIPISRYMKENRFELTFVTPTSLQWSLCSTKQRTGKDHLMHVDSYNATDDSNIYPKGIATKTIFNIEIPAFGYFERQMEFKANIGPSDTNVCRATVSPPSPSVSSAQIILYKINIYRDCN